jgi:hypothetical protein
MNTQNERPGEPGACSFIGTPFAGSVLLTPG